MKILHTSDWHLGQLLYGHDRVREQQHFLDAIHDIALAERPDVFLLCGDIFDTVNPSNATQTMYAAAISRLRTDLPEMDITIIAGNHDSPSKHEIFTDPWECLNVHTYGVFRRDPADMRESIRVIEGKCVIVPIPFFPTRLLPEEYVGEAIDAAEEMNPDGLPVIVLMHTYVAGADTAGHEVSDERYVGGVSAVSVEGIERHVSYLALGHIHKCSDTGLRARYCGSPMAVSFDEDYPHGVSIVEIDGDELSVRQEVIEPLIPLVTIPECRRFIPGDEALERLREFEDDTEAIIRLNIEGIPDAAYVNEAMKICEGKKAELYNINRGRERIKAALCEESGVEVRELNELNPLDIARRYKEMSGDTVLSDEHFALLGEIIDSINQE